MTGSRRLFRTALALAALAVLVASCSGSVKKPEAAVDKMLKAYGGGKNLPLLTTYEGRGFRKQLPQGHVATNYPFDVFQRKMDYKTKTYRVLEGQVVDLQLLIVNKNERFAWSLGAGTAAVPEWEVDMIGYRFPMILELESEKVLLALRNALGMVIITPGFSLTLAAILVVIIVLSIVLTVPALLIMASLFLLIANHATRSRLAYAQRKPYGPEAEGD